LFVCVVIAAALAQQPPAVSFDRGRTAFERGEYSRSIEILRPLLYPEIRLDTEGQVVQAHRMLGVAHLFDKQNDLAAQEFRKLLQLRPDYRFDPLLDPPQVVDFFNGVLHGYEEELNRIEARRRQAARDREAVLSPRGGPEVIERHVVHNSFSINFIPFGAGQFQNGERAKGWVFLLSEAALAGVSVGALTTNFALYGFRPHRTCLPQMPTDPSEPCKIDHTDEDNSKLLTRVQVISGGLFFATAAWGIADAIWHYRPESPVDAGGPAAAPPSASGSRLRLAPVVLGGGWGAALAFRF
jgi:hypothetical protein